MNSLNRLGHHHNFRNIKVIPKPRHQYQYYFSTKATNKEESSTTSHLQKRGELIRKPYETFSKSTLVRYKQRRRNELNILKKNDNDDTHANTAPNHARASSMSTASASASSSTTLGGANSNIARQHVAAAVVNNNANNNFEVRNLLSKEEEISSSSSSIVFQQSATTVHRRHRRVLSLQRNDYEQNNYETITINRKHKDNNKTLGKDEDSNLPSVSYFVGVLSLLSTCAASMCFMI